MYASRCILRIAVPSPLRRCFDYLPPDRLNQTLLPGVRVRVPFGRSSCVGILVEIASETSIDPSRLRPVNAILDRTPILPADILQLLLWASRYYQHPIGEVMQAAVPTALRAGKPASLPTQQIWSLSQTGMDADLGALQRAPKQLAIVNALRNHVPGLTEEQLNGLFSGWRTPMQSLQQKQWVSAAEVVPSLPITLHTASAPALTSEQQSACDQILQDSKGYKTWLLEGVTGSGKTEVYLSVIQAWLDQGKQALILIPEIGLTPQTVRRFQRRFAVPIAVIHSSLSDTDRFTAWLLAAQGKARIVIGTRSAVFTPLPDLGGIIIDEEHDMSFKQQDGFRYHARDVAIVRAREASVPVILGSATPSLETLLNVSQQRYTRLPMRSRIGTAQQPVVQLIDMRKQSMEDGLSAPLLKAISEHLLRNEQVLVFLNRRGFAPTLMCYDCNYIATCKRCDARLTWHQQAQQLRCHHCGAQQPVPTSCPDCQGTQLHPVGHGTERIEEALQRHFKQYGIVRIDRDTTRRRGSMQQLVNDIRAGKHKLLIGTQMIAKGHHFPNVTLVAIINVDQGLFGIDLRASERMAQLIVQVSGRAGRAEKPGRVLIQTWHPDHPLLQTLIHHDYASFAKQALQERQQADFPPYTALALLRAEATDADAPYTFLHEARALAERLQTGIELFGPLDAPMRRRAGRYRAQLLLQADTRQPLQQALARLAPQLEALKSARKVRWSLDVDPQEML